MNAIAKEFQIKPETTGGMFRFPAELEMPFPVLSNLRRKDLDFVVIFVTSAAEIAKHAEPATKALREDGVLWFCDPKKSGAIETDISRDHGWRPLLDLGFAGCRQIAVDETWSALRFREPRFSRRK